MRTSQGGAEEIDVYREVELAAALAVLREKGFVVIGTDVFGRDVFEGGPWRPPAGGTSRVAFVLGSERGGMSAPVRSRCDHLVRVPGRGKVESLNVSVACGVFLALFSGPGARSRSM
jgi:23S rRNA (guanosine2251-2'-O)-methyltransferase